MDYIINNKDFKLVKDGEKHGRDLDRVGLRLGRASETGTHRENETTELQRNAGSSSVGMRNSRRDRRSDRTVRMEAIREDAETRRRKTQSENGVRRNETEVYQRSEIRFTSRNVPQQRRAVNQSFDSSSSASGRVHNERRIDLEKEMGNRQNRRRLHEEGWNGENGISNSRGISFEYVRLQLDFDHEEVGKTTSFSFKITAYISLTIIY